MTSVETLGRFRFLHRVEHILQAERAECGLACLVSVARFHGSSVELSSLRMSWPTGTGGMSLQAIVDVAGSIGLIARPVNVEIEALRKLILPCVLHWEDNHYVVLERVGRRHATIIDPAAGEMKIPISSLRDHFRGIAVEFDAVPNLIDGSKREKLTLLGMLTRIRGLGRAATQILVVSLILEAFALLSPLLLQLAMDQGVVSADRNLVLFLVVVFTCILLIQTAISAFRSWIVLFFTNQLSTRLTSAIARHLLHLPIDFFERRPMADIVSRFASVQAIQRTLTSTFVEILVDGVLSTLTLAVLFAYSLKLTAIVCVAAFIYAMVRVAMASSQSRATARYAVLIAREQGFFFETLRGAVAIKLFGNESRRLAQWLNRVVDTANGSVEVQRPLIWFQIVRGLITGLETIALVGFGILLVIDNALTLGMLVGYLAYRATFSGRFASMIDKLLDVWVMRVHVDRLSDIASCEPERSGGQDLLSSERPIQIELKDVSFKYSPHEPYVVRNVSAVFSAGQSTALVGPSGCGKSTLIKLMLGLLQPTSGEILVDGQSTMALSISRYRAMVGAVLQEDSLFSGTLAENIVFFELQPDREWLVECAKMACIHSDIEAMPMGYNTIVGELGVGLSAGQRQRILIARALYRRPRIIFLDEATSNLDVETEKRVTSAIRRLSITRIQVAHRPEAIRSADSVIELTKAGGTLQLGSRPISDRSTNNL